VENGVQEFDAQSRSYGEILCSFYSGSGHAGRDASQSYADTGSVRLKITKVGFIVGGGGGSGTLHFKGKNYRLRIGGVSAGTIGVAGADLVGTASNLRTAADIAGTYSAVSAGVAVAGGAKAATLQNSNGVILQLQGRQVGFEASLSLGGMTISLQ
jgi:hypothetical protein